ncbi:MAG TPA: 30S ribosomal protein S5 [Candidatus Lokiarchaeia archaeon]|nr:30S ribosomal protein S5 [Candidatus Lokiarchaeia archaeon]
MAEESRRPERAGGQSGGSDRRGGQRKGRKGRDRKEPMRAKAPKWMPRTKVGKMVNDGIITSIDEIYTNVLPIKEVEIIDKLMPNLKEEVCDVKLVQKQTHSGESSNFKVTVVVGTDGYIGLGEAKSKEIGPAIRKAMNLAKLGLIPIKRGCGSWQCGCNEPHTVPFKVRGKAGSVKVELIPAPKGVGLAAADTSKTVLALAGIKDIWSRASGKTRSTANMTKATFDALRRTMKFSSMEISK